MVTQMITASNIDHHASIPTPLQEIHHELLAEKQVRLWVKRDDLIHASINGNKWRKLKYNLLNAQANQHDVLLSFGGAYSNHIYALASAGAIFGFKTIGIIRGELTKPLNATLQHAQNCGMQLHFINRQQYRHKEQLDFIQQLHQQFGRFYLLPEGGSNQLALPGCREISQEITKQIDCDRYTICTPVGSGGTLAGLSLNTSHQPTILGFAVLKNAGFLNANVSHLLAEHPQHNPWQINLDYHFGGYAKVTHDLTHFVTEFTKQTKIPLEPIYSGKMFYGIFDLIKHNFFPKGDTIVALHTGGLQSDRRNTK